MKEFPSINEADVRAGRHRCSFCRLTGGGGFTFDGCAVDVGATNLFVPDDRRRSVRQLTRQLVESSEADGSTDS